MTVKLADAVTTLTTDDTGLKKGMSEAEKTVESSGNKFGSVLQGVGMSIGMGVAGILADTASKVVSFMGDSIGAASDMGETVSKTNVLFGDSADALLAWSDTAATALGQSKQQALDAATTFATFGKSAGLGGDDLVKFSTDFTGLATDLASFNNTSPEEAIQAIGGALRGEAEPLRKYGILLDDASMRNKALQLGLIKTTKEALTPQQKVLAAQALIYEQTSAAQGDFARTSDGLANQQRIMDAQWANLSATLGTALLPVQLAVTQAMNTLLQNVLPPLAAFMNSTVVPAATALGVAFQGLLNIIMGTEPLGDWANWWETLVPLIGEDAANAVHDFGFMLDDLRIAFEKNVGPILEQASGWFTSFGSSSTESMGVLQSALASAQEMFAAFGAVVNKAIGESLNYFAGWFDENMPRIQQIVTTVLTAISDFWTAHGEQIVNTVTTMFTWMVSFFQLQFRTVLNIIEVFLKLFTGDWEGAGQTLQEILNDWKRFFETTIKGIISSITTWFKSVDWGAIGRGILEGIAAGIRNGANYIADAARDAASDAFDAAKDFLGIHSPSTVAAEEIGKPFAQGIGVGIRSALDDMAGGVNVGLQGMMGGIQTPAAAGAGQYSITININGGDAAGIGAAARGGVLDALRSLGVR